MAEAPLLLRDAGPVRWLTLNRPEKRNALGPELIEALAAALQDAREAPVRCLALTGAGRHFSAGADLAALQAMSGAGHEANLADSRRLAALFASIAEHPLPLVAVVKGAALGGGAGLVAACDFAVAAEEAELGFTEVRVGFVPAIVLNFLLRTVGGRAARDLCLTGRRVPAREALSLGLLGAVAPAGELPALIARLGAELAQASPEAVARTKQLFLELEARPLADGLDAAAEANAQARSTPDCKEGVAAFLQKRRPRWAPQP
ncbi:MAG: enoyl-CoA hydratase-related protein [Planctomycetaceae bacterium]